MSEIGVFDSGLGGLTVLRALKNALPAEDFVYLGDTARLPYGSKSPETIRRYVQQNLEFLSKQKVKAVVVACNSASSVLRDAPLKISVPVFEVIQPGAEAALKASQSGRIGVVATWATISQDAYGRALKALNPQVQVYSQACPLLVPLVEEGWVDDPLCNLIVHRYLNPLLEHQIDTLILGCTHYPALIQSFRKSLGPQIEITNSASTVAQKLKVALDQNEIERNPQDQSGQLRLLTTDRTARFEQIARQLLSLQNLPPVTVVDV